MQSSKLTTSLALALGLLGSGSFAFAQNKGGVQAELESIKAELVSLRASAATTPTLAQAVQELSSKVVVLEMALEVKMRSVESVTETLEKVEMLEAKVTTLQTELEYLRTAIANVEQPAVAPHGGGGGAERSRGMKFTTGDGRYSMTLGGYVQPRNQVDLPQDFSSLDSATFSLRRARLSLRGKAGSDRLRYETEFELGSGGTPLLDYYMDMRYRDELTVRAGQSKLPYTRSFLASSTQRAFHELSETQDLQRYDRDIGVWALGKVLDGKLRYIAGVANGSGPNVQNTNIDVAVAARLEGVVLGEYIAPGYGDVDDSDEVRLTVGLAAVHDLVRVPASLSGIDVENRDVDGDGITDNVRAVSTAIDGQLRYQGLDLSLEATWRHERWGSILEHDDNGNIAAAVDASGKGHRNYLGFTAEATYFVMPKKLLIGSRISHGRLPLLGLGGRIPAQDPLAQRAMQFDGLLQLYRDGSRRVGFTYSLLNYNAQDGVDPDNDISHAFTVEAQLLL
ncbi:MAG: hypothetical protein GY811_00765 [Myxococcales bacterium]|nr:hypothetical protein [Myxococcales bacterium]